MATNTPEFTVSELASGIKSTIEQTYGRVRVRGELGRVTIAKSGHCYLDLKDDRAVINSIIWKGSMARLSMRPEEGMEVIATGKMSTYPGRSNYQLVIDTMELAGEGALMALLERRRKAFATEGLFDKDRKRALPFMPTTIGVVTSPTGAVIRDILHRIEDRFPVRVLVWPVLVQGDRAAAQIAGAITGFNNADGFPRPDVLIVARGGGSLEDLWCFNEEVVVRAAANSRIPLISAVGHETDWTLIDYVSDMRAPTPTGAAEVAVPVRDDWLETLSDYGLRLTRALRRNVTDRQTALRAARLPSAQSLLGLSQQRIDAARLPAATRLLEPYRAQLARTPLPNPRYRIDAARARLFGLRLPSPARTLDAKASQLSASTRALSNIATRQLDRRQAQLDRLNLSARPIAQSVRSGRTALDRAASALVSAGQRRIDADRARLDRAGALLDAYSYQGVLQRGYALVTDANGAVIRSAQQPSAGEAVSLTFADGKRAAVIDGATTRKKAKAKPASKGETPQQSLF